MPIISRSLFLKKSVYAIVLGVFFLVTFFLNTGCTKKKPLLSACLTAEEKADLEYFFRFLLFENYGAFVLFGSKPLCEMNFTDTESTAAEEALQQWLESMPEDERKNWQAKLAKKAHTQPELERNLYRGYLAWEKVRKTFEMKHFIVTVDPRLGLGHYDVLLANTEQTTRILAENYDIFRKAAEREFDPNHVVLELKNRASTFWKQVFSLPNHVAKGLLFGFGLKNALLYSGSSIKGSCVSTCPVKFGTGCSVEFYDSSIWFCSRR